MNVLLVEDDDVEIEFVCRTYPQHNIHVASTVAMAVSWLSRLDKIDLAIVDIGIPQVDGDALLIAIQKAGAIQGVKVVGVSMKPQPQHKGVEQKSDAFMLAILVATWCECGTNN